jgi:hypothetical protein
MKKFTLAAFVAVIFFLSTGQTVHATHAVGMDISYTYAGPLMDTVRVKFYRNCGSVLNPNPTQAPPDIEVYYSSPSNCAASGSIIINQIANTGNEVSTGQYPPCGTSFCNGGTGYGVQEYIYEGVLTLPGACSDWVISTYINARNADITTISFPGNQSIYVEAHLDNLNYPTNNSPVFSSHPVSRFCVNHSFNFPQGAVDPDGDSLVFSLVDAETAAGFPIPTPSVLPYIFPYSGANPLASSPPVAINPQTGLITLRDTVVEVGVIAVLVDEYRNGVLIGSVRRDMQVNVEATCNFPPTLTTANVQGAPAGGTANITCGDSIF